MSVESELVSVLKTYKPDIKIFAFEVPDTDKSPEAIAYRSITSRRVNTYYEKNKEVRLTRFHVVRVCDSYSLICDDLDFKSTLNKYTGGSILDLTLVETNDYKMDNVNKFERVYHVDVTHVIKFSK